MIRLTKITVDTQDLRGTLLRFQIGTIECSLNLKELAERTFKEQLDFDVKSDPEMYAFCDIEFYSTKRDDRTFLDKMDRREKE